MDDGGDPVIKDAFDALERVVQAPPQFYQQVSARVAQHPPRRGFRFGSPPPFSGAWGMALAACLLVSLTLNALWSSGVIGARATQPPLPFQPLRSASLLGQIKGDQVLGPYVLGNSILASHDEGLGMISLPPPALFFRIGTGYTESLALLRSEHAEHAIQRLQDIIEALDNVSAPASLVTYAQEMQTLIRSQRHPNPMLAQFLAHFEALYEDAYTGPSNGAALTLFRAGAWLENMDLAAQTGDRAVLRQGPASAYFHSALQSLGVQSGLLSMLEQIGELVAPPTVSDRDVDTVRRLVQRLQHQLSN